MPVDPGFWRGKRVLLTGHTGFKGSWTALWLARMGAKVTGLALPPPAGDNLYEMSRAKEGVASHFFDIRNADGVRAIIEEAQPELVLHMAAQPLVRRSVAEPVETFAVNVMGTVNLLDELRTCPGLKAALIVTTDKVYENAELGRPFTESDALGGIDPYAASKAAAEIATSAYARTYFEAAGVPVATARGGNVIGGGDFAVDRLIPDIFRSIQAGRELVLRYPQSTRPWQHVLDCVAGYLIYLQDLASGKPRPQTLNIGPEAGDGLAVQVVAEAMLQALGANRSWVQEQGAVPYESKLLMLDTRLARATLDWKDYLPGQKAIIATAGWYRQFAAGADMRAVTLAEIDAYQALQIGASKLA